MSTIIRKSNSAATGYEIVDNDVVTAIEKTYPGEPFTLLLPENGANRKYFNSKKVDAAGGQIELAYKESKSFGPRAASTPRKGLEEFLEGDDKATYLALVEKAKAAREAADKKVPMTELEKKQRQVERLMARIKELEGAEA